MPAERPLWRTELRRAWVIVPFALGAALVATPLVGYPTGGTLPAAGAVISIQWT